MSNNAQYATAAAVTVGVLGGAYCVYRAYHESRRKRLPEQWKRVGTLVDLRTYPIKSCRVVTLTSAECSFIGLKVGWLRDRCLVVVDEGNIAVTARAFPEMFHVQPSVANGILTLTNPTHGSVDINLAELVASQKAEKAKVWSVHVMGLDCGKEASEWITKVINRPEKTFRLMYYPYEYGRNAPTDALGKLYNITAKDTGAFSDDTSFNIVNEASVDDLNSRLIDTQVAPANFRPNMVVRGAIPYDEDNWKFVKIGDNIFETILPCTRCVMTTMDPETGVRNANSEPLKTLRSYRLVEGERYRKVLGTAPRMGLQLALRSRTDGLISLNDEVYVA